MTYRYLALISAGLINVGCASIGSNDGLATPQSASRMNDDLQSEKARVFIYRTATRSPSKEAVNIVLNNEYHASLLPGYMTSFDLCAGSNDLQTIQRNVVGDLPKDENRSRTRLNLERGTTSYFSLNGNDNTSLVTSGPEGTNTVRSMPRSAHTVSRMHETTCVPAVVSVMPVVNPLMSAKADKKYTLQAGALFAFGKSSAADISKSGRAQINVITQELLRNVSNIVSISIVGHTDPEGAPAFNQRLSENRANSVAALFTQAGIPAQLIHTQGKGETELAKSCQGAANPATFRACNEVNRRIEIFVRGQQH